MEDKKYLVQFMFLAEVKGEDHADALNNAAFDLKDHFKGVRRPSVQVMREVVSLPEVVAAAVAEAPFADQVTVREEPLAELPGVGDPVPVMADDIPF